ncbi:MAG: low molecular weight phosphotyrosine protein phosphatase [Puniceicoccales bacterium]|jgi:protein-tyrosine-phosphatase|nr:low molecular weight phosphotyrosine protein phosphatase [Puniceicoccales bacterium]
MPDAAPETPDAPAAAAPAAAPAPKHITIICTGNICRSPMGEGLLRHALKAEQAPLRDVPVVSCGTSAWHEGEAATANAVRALQKCGIDISAHRSRQVTKRIVENSLAIFAMTSDHLETLHDLYGDTLPAPAMLMRGLMDLPAEELYADEVADPFGGDLHRYEDCRDDIVAAVPSILNFLRGLVK